MVIWVLLHLLVAGECARRAPARHRDVHTTQGPARGYFAPRPPHYAFLGLPYARMPTRDRFKAPRPPPRWDGTFEATHRVKCLQPDGGGTEACLVVNVFAPEGSRGRPVLVHLHGGGFQRGWGSHKPPVRLLELGFVVVTFNYRLGALGFLCLRSAGIPGNAGLKDQVAALYWVHKNIARFGGNPQDVTVHGTGSGAVSVELLLLSELTAGLIHKAIIESGAVLSPSSISYDPYAIALADALALGFEGTSEPKHLEMFYKTISIKSIANTTQMYLPCIENNLVANSLLDMDPMDMLNHGIYQHVPLMVIYTNAEEVLLVAEHIDKFNVAPQNFKQLLPINLDFETEELREKMAAMIRDFYFDEYELSDSVVQNYVDYINDVFMEYPITKSSALHAAKSNKPVYLMKYTYKAHSGYAKPGDVFNLIFPEEDTTGFDEIVVQRILTVFRNFVELGDPTPLTSSLMPVVWQPVTVREVEGKIDIHKVTYLKFDKDVSNASPEGQQLIFWDYIYYKYYKQYV